jgi:cytochrome c5
MMPVKALMIGWLAIAVGAAIGQTSDAPQSAKVQKASQKTAPASPDRGQQVFKQNCYRCHQEPQGFSPSISGTVARHMRVRAGLSEEDYKALMKFLNP